MQEIASGLRFPEGPIAMDDGSVILVEIARGTLTRVTPTGNLEVIADLGGGPNGAAIGPDGAVYVCNNGGFAWAEHNGALHPGDIAADYSGGRIERVDLASGKSEVLYTACDGEPLRGPNDIVFDKSGGFWFTDLGKGFDRLKDRGAVYYAKADGSFIEQMVFPMETPNGIGLSPQEDKVYVAETQGARLWGFELEAPGKIKGRAQTSQKNFIASPSGLNFFDSLAVEADGTICVATIVGGGISRIHPETGDIRHVATDDFMTTNICFGGADLKTAYITASSSGRLLKTQWDAPGLPLNFLNL
ncbi:MAG: SMP-30/gluconolactonase/LRE family protein [Alphaproteobacteria bacterium]|nr:SMP-30/gluconolactonase/LRE family protein [Alphaproteobacteria bacterium]